MWSCSLKNLDEMHPLDGNSTFLKSYHYSRRPSLLAGHQSRLRTPFCHPAAPPAGRPCSRSGTGPLHPRPRLHRGIHPGRAPKNRGGHRGHRCDLPIPLDPAGPGLYHCGAEVGLGPRAREQTQGCLGSCGWLGLLQLTHGCFRSFWRPPVVIDPLTIRNFLCVNDLL